MSLRRATIAKVVKTAFNITGDIPESVTFRRSTTTYVPSTGTSTIVNSDATLDMIFTAFQSYEIDRVNITVADVKAIFESRLLAITPNTTTDKVIRSGKTYNILSAKTDPSGSIYTLQLRAP